MKKVLIGMPTVGNIPTQTVAALMQLRTKMGNPQVAFVNNSLVYDARNEICLQAINEGFDEVLFIDSDMIFPDDAYEKLEALDCDIASGVYYGRAGEHKPVVYYEVTPRTEKEPATAKAFETIPDGTFSIKGCGMGLCLIQRRAIEEICQMTNNMPFEPWNGLGEDLAFCYRAKKEGFTIKANTYIPLGHIGTAIYTAKDYQR